MISAFQALLIEAACLFWNVGDDSSMGIILMDLGRNRLYAMVILLVLLHLMTRAEEGVAGCCEASRSPNGL